MVIGLWPGFRFTTATFSHSEPRSMLETAVSDLIRNNDSRDIPNLNFVRNGENRRRFLTQAGYGFYIELTREWPEVESTREMAYEKRTCGEIDTWRHLRCLLVSCLRARYLVVYSQSVSQPLSFAASWGTNCPFWPRLLCFTKLTFLTS